MLHCSFLSGILIEEMAKNLQHSALSDEVREKLEEIQKWAKSAVSIETKLKKS